ncbi:DUF420 domain-containing protein [Salisediminibacterium halotolerans]|uniref:Membrane protein n=1 Tax=Salisediminibacterium halotolerans TaxID=517425 RepID=A0A1H9PSP9_9BACI|nr:MULTISPECIES: DUF420 domain-containing protein [Salisediminibacterium]RLJ74331.1 putative membrane protein [Actinophytocola xinjiangensis]RPE87576.1 putative membrane protein [Salisediminibacterium halotolerans]TWG35168.1 putative membrane protein [Salisediminibacterium halotolerans]SER51138.1 putative membrane protein [Salisediminibacterium haloalkalitolerans]GEL08621.1 membrane protein [Salisediminibacterium halotolerans]
MEYFLPFISTVFIAISAVFVAVGWVLVAKGHIETHKKSMFWAAVFAVIFFATYLSRTIFIGSTSFGGPDDVRLYYTVFLVFHITMATIAAVLGIIQLTTGYKNKLRAHKKLGPITSVIWFISSVTGIAVYLLLYIIYPPGETTNLFDAIIGASIHSFIV